MQVSRGNILKTIGMLCNPNFVYKRIIGLTWSKRPFWWPHLNVRELKFSDDILSDRAPRYLSDEVTNMRCEMKYQDNLSDRPSIENVSDSRSTIG